MFSHPFDFYACSVTSSFFLLITCIFFSDYGFQRKRVDEECTPIRLGDDLNDNTIPQDCPEGSFYNKTRGYDRLNIQFLSILYQSGVLNVFSVITFW